MTLTAEQLQSIYGISKCQSVLWIGPFTMVFQLYQIDTPKRVAAFLAQVGHESGRLKYVKEIWGPTPAQARYEGRSDLGNNQPGDGARFRGRGLIQITGRANYKAISNDLGIDFVNCPEALESPYYAVLSAGWYWDTHELSRYADSGDFETLTKRINGGLNGIEERKALLAKAQSVLEGK